MGLTTLPHFNTIDNFYKNKSIVNGYMFSVFLNFDKYKYGKNTNHLPFFDRLLPFHILSVDVPTPSFSRGDGLHMGATQYTYPVLTKEQGLDINITFEEDIDGTIAGFIQEMQESVIRKGYHVAPALSRLGEIMIIQNTQTGVPVSQYIAKDVFFLGAEQITSDYTSTDSVKYTLKFGTDIMTYDDAPVATDVISTSRLSLDPTRIFR